jgi:hypothetical protein
LTLAGQVRKYTKRPAQHTRRPHSPYAIKTAQTNPLLNIGFHSYAFTPAQISLLINPVIKNFSLFPPTRAHISPLRAFPLPTNKAGLRMQTCFV